MRVRKRWAAAVLIAGLVAGFVAGPAASESLRPMPRPAPPDPLPTAQWDFREDGAAWSRAALSALRTHGKPLTDLTPKDIQAWCPGYVGADEVTRRAFWVGFLSALAKHESTWRAHAVGGGGLWYGLLQILPSTARLYGCEARTGAALKDGGANLSCAIRIMARTVPRDGVIHARQPRWSGVSADWGPMRSAAKRQDMANWLRGQPYCQMHASPRPVPRPVPAAWVMGPQRPALRPLPRPSDRTGPPQLAPGPPTEPPVPTAD